MSSAKQVKEVKKDATKKRHALQGVVVSDGLDKTIVVSVMAYKTHKKYLKKYRDSKKYKVHDEENKYKVGDKVSFVECRPLSKDKKWTVLDK